MLRRLSAGGLAVATTVAVTACGSTHEKTISTAQRPAQTSTADRLVATLKAPNHTPKVGTPWVITVTANDRAGHAVSAHLQYLFLFNGAVVAKRSDLAFKGVIHDNIGWPAQAVGIALTF